MASRRLVLRSVAAVLVTISIPPLYMGLGRISPYVLTRSVRADESPLLRQGFGEGVGDRDFSLHGAELPLALGPAAHEPGDGLVSTGSDDLVARLDLRGVRARSAQFRDSVGRELAWFPASVRSIARQVRGLAFTAWFGG